MGTPEFAVPTLERIVAAGHEVLSVITQPDRPKGRTQAMTPSPVKTCALRHGLAVFQPERVRRADAVAAIAALQPDAMVVVGYGQIIPQSVIDLAPLGIINVHASLLPKLRGAAPIQWAIARGETVTGVTTMRIDAGLDTGDILLRAIMPIGNDETAIELSPKLAVLGAGLLIQTLDALADGSIVPQKQDDAQATLAPILKKRDGRIDWLRTAREIHNQVRGLQPWPGANTSFRGSALQIWRTRVASETHDAAPGRLLREPTGMLVACGAGTALELLEVQMEGRKRMSAEAFANGHRVLDNEILGELSH